MIIDEEMVHMFNPLDGCVEVGFEVGTDEVQKGICLLFIAMYCYGMPKEKYMPET